MTIELHTWNTPNGRKISVALEEMGLPYTVIPVNISKGEQMAPSFLEISPNNKIPAIVDPDGPDGKPISIFESGAILLYLGEKTGKLLPTELRAKYKVMEWLMFQMGGVGPMFGQRGHFMRAAPEKLPYAIERYTNESRRLLNVIEKQLAETAYLAGDYSIADMATYPWVVGTTREPEQLESRPNFQRWLQVIRARPAVKRGVAVMADVPPEPLDDEARSILYGNKQFELR